MAASEMTSNSAYGHVEYDAENDVHVVYAGGHLATPADVERWFAVVRDYRPTGFPYDAILVLEMFTVAPDVQELFAKRFTYISDELIRYQVMVDVSPTVARTLRSSPKSTRRFGLGRDIPDAISVLHRLRQGHG